MARHRSPQCRHVHLGSLLSAAAGTGRAGRVPALPQVGSALPAASLPARLVSAAVAGSVLAATGQMTLAQALPAALDGAEVLRLRVGELLTPRTAAAAEAATPNPAPTVAEPWPAVVPVLLEPQVVSAADLVKAAELGRVVVEKARLAERVQTAADAQTSVQATGPGGGVQMLAGRITSGFGLRGNARHNGLDIAAPIGTPIRVPLDGTVINSGPASGFGLWVRVRHSDGTITLYGHINRTLVKVGQRVSAGAAIAQVGNRGQSSGPHLHFEVITPGGSINPTPWLAERGVGVT